MSRVAGEVAIVTGGSGDIGRAIAATLAHTMQVVITARSIETLAGVAADIGRETGSSVHAISSNALDQASVDALMTTVFARMGRVDVLVNCAASTASVAGRIEDVAVDALIADLDTKVGGYLRYTRAAVPLLKARGGGRIVNIGGLTGRASETLSGMRNVAVSHLTKVLSDQLGPHNITVNAVHPGIVATPHLNDVFRNHAREREITPAAVEAEYLEDIPLRRLLVVEEIADAVATLLSPSMAAITGQSITVDAGYSRGVYL